MPDLTPREAQVHALLEQGYSRRQIAVALGIGLATVHEVVKRIAQRREGERQRAWREREVGQ